MKKTYSYQKLERELNPEFFSHQMKTCKSCKLEKSLLNFPPQGALCSPCLKQKDWKRREKNIVRETWAAAKRRAQKSNIEFSITEEDVQNVWADTCPIFGFSLKRNTDRAGPDSPSLDRINNTKGYIPGNIAIVSQKFNTMKRELTPEILRLMLRYIENPSSLISVKAP